MKYEKEEKKRKKGKGKRMGRRVKGEKCERDVFPRGGFRQEFRMRVQLAVESYFRRSITVFLQLRELEEKSRSANRPKAW